MVFLEFLAHFATSILIGYLAFTSVLADGVIRFTPEHAEKPVETVSSKVQEPETKPTDETLPTISDGHIFGGSIPKILLENSDFQKAAVVASGIGETESTTSSGPLSERVKGALVNIYCQYKTRDYIRTTTGTGFFVNRKGVILTNAHVAQFLLLKDVEDSVIDSECTVRTGDPATPQYKAELLYISPEWIYENAKLITEEMPRGTGERDYALLYVSKRVDKTPLPASFPSIPVDTALLARSTQGISVLTAGYPAEALFRDGAKAKLFPVVASTTVGELYTFGSNYADVFAVSSSKVGEQGASGGPIVKDDGRAIGIIVTKGNEKTEGERSLRAITLSYVDRTITDETGFTLLQNMQGDLAFRGKIFKKALVPFLSKLLTDEITAGQN